jgi:hypothetical protein
MEISLKSCSLSAKQHGGETAHFNGALSFFVAVFAAVPLYCFIAAFLRFGLARDSELCIIQRVFLVDLSIVENT